MEGWFTLGLTNTYGTVSPSKTGTYRGRQQWFDTKICDGTWIWAGKLLTGRWGWRSYKAGKWKQEGRRVSLSSRVCERKEQTKERPAHTQSLAPSHTHTHTRSLLTGRTGKGRMRKRSAALRASSQRMRVCWWSAAPVIRSYRSLRSRCMETRSRQEEQKITATNKGEEKCLCMGIRSTLPSLCASRWLDTLPWLAYKSSLRLHYRPSLLALPRHYSSFSCKYSLH